MTARRLALIAALLMAVTVTAAPARAHAPSEGLDLWFPVQLPVDSFSDTWGDARSEGRGHEGVDIMAPQMREAYAAQDGEIIKAKGEDCASGEYCSSFYLAIAGDDGRGYFYVHLNNDTPGRPDGCDGTGGYEAAFSPRLVDELEARGTLEGVRVSRGEHIGYVGSSGNAGCASDQLHFEIWNDHDWGSTGKTNPYPHVKDAYDAGRTWGPDGGPPPPGPHGRDAGADRVLTAVALSSAAFETAEQVVIASAATYPDALTAAPLAALRDAPVLLVHGDQADPAAAVPDAVVDEIRRLGATSATLVGGERALGPAVEDGLRQRAGIPDDDIRRLDAADRFEASAIVADTVVAEGGSVDSPLLALGAHPEPDRGWPDAIAGSTLAAVDTAPILLTGPDRLADPVREFLARDGVREIRIVGGTAAISAEIEATIRDEIGKPTRRLAGATRYGTGLAVAEAVIERGSSTTNLHVATGRNWPDALAAAPALTQLGQALVLVDGLDGDGAAPVYGWLRDRADAIDQVHATGGPAAVSDPVLDRVASYADWPR